MGILKCSAELCDLRGAHAALEDRLNRAELVLGSASDCTPPSGVDDSVTLPHTELSMPEAERRFRNIEGEIAALQSNLNSCADAVTFAVKDARERDSAVSAVQAAVEGLQTVEALSGQHHKQIQELAHAIKAMRVTIASLHSEPTHAELAHADLATRSPPQGGVTLTRYTSGPLVPVARDTSGTMPGGLAPGAAIARSSHSSSQPHVWTSLNSTFDGASPRDNDCPGSLVHGTTSAAHPSPSSPNVGFSTPHVPPGYGDVGWYLSHGHHGDRPPPSEGISRSRQAVVRSQPITSPRLDLSPLPVARAPSPPGLVSRRVSQAEQVTVDRRYESRNHGIGHGYVCATSQGPVVMQTLGVNRGSVWYG